MDLIFSIFVSYLWFRSVLLRKKLQFFCIFIFCIQKKAGKKVKCLFLNRFVHSLIFKIQKNGVYRFHGRLVRKGGTGFFTMYLQRKVDNPHTRERLFTLTQSMDGHYIAKQDLLLRGVGDLRQGSTQHGRYQGLILNAQVDIELMEKLVVELA